MSAGDIIQIIGIILSTVLGVLTLIIGIKNYRAISYIKQILSIDESVNTVKAKQKSKVTHNSTSIQVGGNIS